MPKRIVVALILLTLCSGCASHQVAFFSQPAGARVAIDGKVIGETPCKFRYTASSGRTFEVTVEKEGFEAFQYCLVTDKIDKKARKKWLTAGLVWSPLWLGTLFTKKLPESYHFALRQAPPHLVAQNPPLKTDLLSN